MRFFPDRLIWRQGLAASSRSGDSCQVDIETDNSFVVSSPAVGGTAEDAVSILSRRYKEVVDSVGISRFDFPHTWFQDGLSFEGRVPGLSHSFSPGPLHSFCQGLGLGLLVSADKVVTSVADPLPRLLRRCMSVPRLLASCM